MKHPQYLGIFLLIASASTLSAATYTWQNPQEGAWMDGTNWDLQTVPPLGSGIIIDNNSTAVLKDIDNANIATLTLGATAGNTGTLNMQDYSSLTATGVLNIGSAGDGYVNMSGSSQLTSTSYVYLGNSAGSYGQLVLNDTSKLSTTANFYLGNSGTALLDINGDAQLSTGRNMNIADATGSNATLNLNGGTLTINGIASGSDGLWVGNAQNSEGYVNIDGGTLDVKGMIILGNDAGHGEITMNSGQINVTDLFAIGAATGTTTGSSGSVTINGGTLNTKMIVIGQGAGTNATNGSQGNLNIGNGGTVIADGNVSIGYAQYAQGTLRINQGGTLISHAITAGNGASVPTGATSLLVIDGGTIKTHANFVQSNYFINIVDVLIESKGATIDSNGKTTAIGSAIRGTGKLTKTGSNFMYLVGNNSFSGGIDINQGDVIAGNLNALGTGIVTVNSGTNLQSNVVNVSTGGINLQGGTLSIYDGIGATAPKAGSYTLSGNFTMNSGLYNLDIINTSLFDTITGNGTNSFLLNGGTISLNGDIDYAAQYLIFENFLNGTIGNINFTGYDSENWTLHMESNGTLWFSQIPEPSTSALLLGILTLPFVRRRKRPANTPFQL